MPVHRRQPSPSRFSALPPRNRPQILNQLLRDSQLRPAVSHHLATRNDLRFRVLTFDYATTVQNAMQNLPPLTPSMAFALQPIMAATEAFLVTSVNEMLDMGIERRLDHIDIRVLSGRQTPLPFAESDDSDPEFPHDLIGQAENTLANIRWSMSLHLCANCERVGHIAHHCPYRSRRSTARPIRPPVEVQVTTETSQQGEIGTQTESPITFDTPPPEPAPETNGVLDYDTRCYNCGIVGHGDHNCPYDSAPSSRHSTASLEDMGLAPHPSD